MGFGRQQARVNIDASPEVKLQVSIRRDLRRVADRWPWENILYEVLDLIAESPAICIVAVWI